MPTPTPDQVRKYFETRVGQKLDAGRQITRCPLHIDTAQNLSLDLEDGRWWCQGEIRGDSRVTFAKISLMISMNL
jgi:hypothetical protein